MKVSENTLHVFIMTCRLCELDISHWLETVFIFSGKRESIRKAYPPHALYMAKATVYTQYCIYYPSTVW